MDPQVTQTGLKFLAFLSLMGKHHHMQILTGN